MSTFEDSEVLRYKDFKPTQFDYHSYQEAYEEWVMPHCFRNRDSDTLRNSRHRNLRIPWESHSGYLLNTQYPLNTRGSVSNY